MYVQSHVQFPDRNKSKNHNRGLISEDIKMGSAATLKGSVLSPMLFQSGPNWTAGQAPRNQRTQLCNMCTHYPIGGKVMV